MSWDKSIISEIELLVGTGVSEEVRTESTDSRLKFDPLFLEMFETSTIGHLFVSWITDDSKTASEVGVWDEFKFRIEVTLLYTFKG